MSHMQRAAHISTPHWLLWYVWWWSWSWEWNVQSAGNVSNGRPNRKLGCVHNLSVVKFEGLANCRSFLCWQACRWVSSRSLFDSRWPAALLNVTDLFSTCFTCNCPKIKNRGGGVLALIRAAVCASDSSAPPTLFGGISSSSSSLFLKRLICSGRPAWRQQVDAISTASTAITQQMDCHIPQRRRGPQGRTVRPCVYCPFHFFFHLVFSTSHSTCCPQQRHGNTGDECRQRKSRRQENGEGGGGGVNLHGRTRNDLVRLSVTLWGGDDKMESCPPLRPQQKDLQLLSSIFSSRAHETRAPSSSPLHVSPGRTGQLYLKLYEVSGKPFNVGADVFMSGKLVDGGENLFI